MRKPKIEIGVKRETNDPSNKLTFSREAQQAARARIEEERKRNKHVPIRVVPLQKTVQENSIYQKQVEELLDQEPNIIDENAQEEQDKLLLNSEQYPFFPGIYSTLYRPEQDMHFEQGLHTPPVERKHDQEQQEESYLDLGPIYEEKERPRVELGEWTPEVSDQKIVDDLFDPIRPRSKFIGGLKIVLSVLGAVGLGAFFGYMLLLFYLMGTKTTDGTIDQTNMNQVVEERVIATNPVDMQLTQGGKLAVGKLTVADRTFYAIQAGVFTEQKTGVEATLGLQQKDVPTILFNDDVHRLFIGIGYQEQDVVNLSQYYKLLGSEIYLKKYTIQGGVVSIPGATMEQMDILNKYITHGTYLLERTAAWTGAAVKGELTITDDAWQKYKSTHNTFLAESEQLQAFLTSEQSQFTRTMSQSMDHAVLSMVTYIENNDRAQFVASQQGLMDYFIAYRELLKSTGIDVVMR